MANENKPVRCDHKFVGSKVCLKCGWRPFCGDIKYAHAGCCEPDPNLKVTPEGRKEQGEHG